MKKFLFLIPVLFLSSCSPSPCSDVVVGSRVIVEVPSTRNIGDGIVLGNLRAGKIAEISKVGILLEEEKQRTFIPWGSIVTITILPH